MNGQWAAISCRIEGFLEDIKTDYDRMIETRSAILGGKATKEQMFLAVNSAATNMVIFQGFCEQYLKVVVEMKKIEENAEIRRQPAKPERRSRARLHLVQ